MSKSVEVITPETVADFLAEQGSELIFEGNQINVIKGKMRNAVISFVINNALGENLFIKLSYIVL